MSTEILAIGENQPSLTGTGSQYVVIQARASSSHALRIQGSTGGKKWEHDIPCSPGLALWFSKVPHSRTSIVNSSTKYAPALMRCEQGTENKVRVQIPGPAKNREWGVCFLLTDSLLYNHAKHGGAA